MSSVSILEKTKCFSCRSCYLSCPENAIDMIENAEGFFYPEINSSCVDCGLCVKKCPALNPFERGKFEQESKVAWLKDAETLSQSTSGGLFAGIAEKIIADGGVVFGADYDDELNVNQVFVENENDLRKLKGSKYVESFTNDSFRQVKDFLESGRKVFYSGTPCQIAGLKQYLSKNYENLITADLICHGVPSRKLFKKYLEWLGKRTGGKIIYYGFRDKDVGGWTCGGKTKTKTKTKTIDGSCDPYYTSFLRCDTYRESCYTCPFSSMNRPGDVTIGDFFEVSEFYPELDRTKGISLLIVNNKKGKKYFESVEDKFNLLPIEQKQYLPIKGNLQTPSPRPNIRNNIYSDIDILPPKEFFKRFKEAHLSYRLSVKTKWVLRYGILKIIPRPIKNWGKRVLKKLKVVK